LNGLGRSGPDLLFSRPLLRLGFLRLLRRRCLFRLWSSLFGDFLPAFLSLLLLRKAVYEAADFLLEEVEQKLSNSFAGGKVPSWTEFPSKGPRTGTPFRRSTNFMR
jgi:hypothetical protein